MERFFIITNRVKDPDRSMQEQIRKYLEARGKTVDAAAADERERIRSAEADCFLVLGGDGTMLQAARDTAEKETPLLGINLGKVGYLAEVERTNWQDALDQLLAGDCEIEERMMLTGSIRGVGHRENSQRPNYALNDVAITRSGALQIIPYNVYVNDQFLNLFQADGMIISTPTGSTGYNLSAGGPIVEPSAQLLLLTPICPHTLNTRSIVLAPQDRIAIEIGTSREGRKFTAEADFDGCENPQIMHSGDRIEIERSERRTRIVKLSRRSFLETLHGKMSS